MDNKDRPKNKMLMCLLVKVVENSENGIKEDHLGQELGIYQEMEGILMTA